MAGTAAGVLLTAGAGAQTPATPQGRIVFLGWTANLEYSVWLSGVDPGEFFVTFPETGARVDEWTQPERGLHITVSPEVREFGGTHLLFTHIRDEFSEFDNFVDSDDQQPGRFTFPDHWDPPTPDLPDPITPEVRPNPDTLTPELRPNPDTLTPTLRPNPDTLTPTLRPNPDTLTPTLRPNPDTLTPALRPNPDTLTPTLRPNPDTLTPGLRPDPDTLTPGLRPDPDTLTPGLRPDPDTLTPGLRPDPDTLTPGLRPDPDTLTPGLRPDPDTLTPGLRPDPDTLTPGLRPDPDTLTPGLRPTPDTLTPELRPSPDTLTPERPGILRPARPDPGGVTAVLPKPITPVGVPSELGERRVVMTAEQICRAGREGRLKVDGRMLRKACEIDAASRRRWTAWGEWTYTSLSDHRFGGEADGSSHRFTVGLDRQVGSRTVTGVAFELGRSRYESFNGQLRQKSDDVAVKPYVVHRIGSSPLYLDATVGFHFSDYKQDVLILSGEHDSFALSGTAGVSTQYAVDGFVLRPRLSLSYASIWHDAFALEGDVAGLHLRVRQREAQYDFGATSGSLEISRPIRTGGVVVTPYLEGEIEYAFQRPNGGRVLTPALNMASTSSVTGSARLGARVQLKPNIALVGSVAYYGIGTPDLSSWQWRTYLSLRF